MDEQSGDELRSLRQRAYGPKADIHEDPIALERLRELEKQAAPRRSVPVEPADQGLAAPWEDDPESPSQEFGGRHSGRTVAPLVQEPRTDERSLSALPSEARTDEVEHPAEGVADAADPSGDTTSSAEAGLTDPSSANPVSADPPRASRRGALIWAAALTAALLVGAIFSYVAVGLAPGSVAVLQADPDGEWPDGFSPRDSGSELFERFYGLTIVLVSQDWNGGAPSPCLFVLTNPSEGLIGGAGCGAGDFEPVTAVTVTEQMPKALTEEFPVGSALQFELRDGEVIVFADVP